MNKRSCAYTTLSILFTFGVAVSCCMFTYYATVYFVSDPTKRNAKRRLHDFSSHKNASTAAFDAQSGKMLRPISQPIDDIAMLCWEDRGFLFYLIRSGSLESDRVLVTPLVSTRYVGEALTEFSSYKTFHFELLDNNWAYWIYH